MKSYKIIHEEKLVGWWYVDANSEQDALDEFDRMVTNGEVDFSDMEMVDSSNQAVPETSLNICGDEDCEGCLFQHLYDITICQEEAKRRKERK